MPKEFKILLDIPAEGQLALGFAQLADAFADVVQNSDPRFAVGLFGGWGSGKTTLMHAIESRLDRNQCVPVWFSAWRYEKEQHLIVPLLDVVREGLVEWSDRRKGRAKKLAETALGVADTIGKAVYSLLAGFSLKVGIPKGPEVSFDANKTLSKAEAYDEEAASARVPRSFYHASFAALRTAFAEFTGPSDERRIVVFVDDLDRCLAEGALEVLESMKLFFDLPGFVFVVGLDRRIVELSVDKRYRDILPADGKGGELVSGAQYLRKIFQMPYTLAPVSTDQIDEFLGAMQAAAKLPVSQWDEIKKHVRPHLSYLTGDSGVNPREVKRFVNAYTLVRKTRSWLDKDVVLALQTIAFRPDWSSINLTLLAFRDVFRDALRRQIDEPERRHLEGLNPDLASLPQSFMSFVEIGGPGRALVDLGGPIDEFIYSGEATRSSQSTVFIDVFREMGGLIEPVRRVTNGALQPTEARDQASKALSLYRSVREGANDMITTELQEFRDHRFFDDIMKFQDSAPGSDDWTRLNDAVKTGETELIDKVRRAMRYLQDLYQTGTAMVP